MKKNKNRGFIIPLFVAIIILLSISGGAYVYTQKEKNIINTETPATTSVQTQANIKNSTGPDYTPPEPINPNICNENSECGVGNMCYFKPGGSVGSCITSFEKKGDKENVTESDILNATYVISGNFIGEKTPAQRVVFPKKTSDSNVYGSLSGVVFMDKNGEVSQIPMGQVYEAFVIQDYQFNDKQHFTAKVRINGNFGASGNDGHLFLISNIGGEIVTKELPCTNRALNGYCSFE